MSLRMLFFSDNIFEPRWKRLFIYSPVAKLLIFGLFLLITSALLHGAFIALGLANDSQSTSRRIVTEVIQRIVPPLISYYLVVFVIEKKTTPRLLALNWRRAGLAVMLGAIAFCSIFILITLLRGFQLLGFRSDVPWFESIFVFCLASSIGEEIVARGVLFRFVEEGTNRWFAMAFSVLAFGTAHLLNPSATIWSTASFAIQHGLLAVAIYCYVQRNLLVCIGAHAGWSVMQSAIFGAHGLLMYKQIGPKWLSGGVFGIEASAVTAFTCLAIALWLMKATKVNEPIKIVPK